MKNYIRFGEIYGEKSINFCKMTFDHQDLLNFLKEVGATERISGWLKEECEYCLENGISVFEIDNDGFPLINSLMLIISLHHRIGEKIYLVEGEEAGRGNDDEPLLQNVKIIKELKFTEKDLYERIYETLKANYKTIEKDSAFDGCHSINEFEDMDGTSYLLCDAIKYTNPVENFCTTTGTKK